MKVRNSIPHNSESRTNDVEEIPWDEIDWNEVYKHVNRLQTRIAKATREKKWHLVKRLQYLLTHSYYAKLLAVRTVTKNHGARTPGVDGELWNTPESKLQAAKSLSDKRYKAKPLRRIYIPKPGKTTKRPISIPSMYDRAMQALYNLGLQPIAETLADKRSFGFRLYRSSQDAIQYAFLCLRYKTSSEWILEGDIAGCFDTICHEWLCKNIPMDTSILKQFLKSGYIFDDQLFPTDRGTPQGGHVSPTLANMTLDGMESLIMDAYPKMKVHFIRYADDFLVTCPTKEIAEEIKGLISNFLETRGLLLSDTKTTITHINDGVNFLGFNIRKYQGILKIKPSKESISKVVDKTRGIILKARAWKQEDLIRELNPVIMGWTNYYRSVVASETFSYLDMVLWNQLWKWGKHRHANKGHKWIARRYWHRKGSRNWDFSSENHRLKNFSGTKIRRHVMVKLDANPYLDRRYFLWKIGKLNSYSDIQLKLTFFSWNRPIQGL